MIPRLLVRGALVLPLLAPATALAQGVAIEHEEIGCIVAGEYPKMNACFTPASLVKKPRVYFRPETLSTWYYVEMSSDAPCFSGVLLRPSKALIDKRIFYYLDVPAAGSRTPEYAPLVVARAEDCKSKKPIAPFSATGPLAVYPSLPPSGFVVGAGATRFVVAAGLAAAAVVGGTKLLTDDEITPNPTPPSVPVSNPPATPPPVSVPTPAPPALVIACQAGPRNGPAPLRVDFATFPSGGTGVYAFQWAFGYGAESSNPNPAHTYTAPGTFNATVSVTSGGQTVACARPITVTAPPPVGPAPPGPFTLTVSLAGSGSGQVTGPGIACGADCSEAYANGTLVTLTATPDAASTFFGWLGACSGTGACTVTMNAAQSVTAKFELKTVLLTVTTTGAGTGTVSSSPTGIACGADCTEPYPVGTLVTLTATPTGGSVFGGWGGTVPAACLGAPAPTTCTVTMDASKTVTAQFNPPVPGPFTATVALAGSGSGTVTSAPPGINCPGDCSEPYANGTIVNLTPTPSSSPAAVFTQWTGDCTGSGPCTLNMTANRNVTAQFEVLRTLSLQGGGSKSDVDGAVSSSPAGITCSWPPRAPTCTTSATYVNGTAVTLTASSSVGFFTLWEADCLGAVGNICNVLMDADKTVIVNTQSPPIPIRSGAPVVFSTVLEVPDGEGQVVMNGSIASAVRPGLAAMAIEGRRGTNRAEAVLVRGSGRPGTWRFELGGRAALKPGSLRVVAGTVVLITGDAVVFRLQGNPGERVVFTFEVED